MLAVSFHQVSNSHIPAGREDRAILGYSGPGSKTKEHQDIHGHDAWLHHMPGECQDVPQYSKCPD
jgi:hypothetical protein